MSISFLMGRIHFNTYTPPWHTRKINARVANLSLLCRPFMAFYVNHKLIFPLFFLSFFLFILFYVINFSCVLFLFFFFSIKLKYIVNHHKYVYNFHKFCEQQRNKKRNNKGKCVHLSSAILFDPYNGKNAKKKIYEK